MEHMLYIALSSGYGFAMAGIAALAALWYSLWAWCLPSEHRALKKVSQAMTGLAVMAVLFWIYAGVMVPALHGVAGIAARHVRHVTWFVHASQPWAFWATLVFNVTFAAFFMMLALVSTLGVIRDKPATNKLKRGTRSMSARESAQKLAELTRRKQRGSLNWVIAVTALIVIASVVWVGSALHQVTDVWAQVAAGTQASMVAQRRVEAFAQDHDRLPNEAELTQRQADLSARRSRYMPRHRDTHAAFAAFDQD